MRMRAMCSLFPIQAANEPCLLVWAKALRKAEGWDKWYWGGEGVTNLQAHDSAPLWTLLYPQCLGVYAVGPVNDPAV